MLYDRVVSNSTVCENSARSVADRHRRGRRRRRRREAAGQCLVPARRGRISHARIGTPSVFVRAARGILTQCHCQCRFCIEPGASCCNVFSLPRPPALPFVLVARNSCKEPRGGLFPMYHGMTARVTRRAEIPAGPSGSLGTAGYGGSRGRWGENTKGGGRTERREEHTMRAGGRSSNARSDGVCGSGASSVAVGLLAAATLAARPREIGAGVMIVTKSHRVRAIQGHSTGIIIPKKM